MTDGGFHIGQSAALMADLRRLSEVARGQGRFRLFVQSLGWIVSELERTPMEFGESGERLEAADLWRRRGFAGPLFVEYAVHLGERRVFLRRFVLLP